MEATVLSVRPLRSPIPSGGLEIMLMAKLTINEKDIKILKYLQQLIKENYKPETDFNETDAETPDQLLETGKIEEEEHEVDDVIFIEDEEDEEEE